MPDYDVLGSNVKIVVPGKEGDLNADISVVQEPLGDLELPMRAIYRKMTF
jgi:hypothetical protein